MIQHSSAMTVIPAAHSPDPSASLRRRLRPATRLGVVLGLLIALNLDTLAQAAEPDNNPAVEETAPEVITNADCIDCHQDATLTRTVQGRTVPLAPLVLEIFEASVHGALNCVDCHTGVTELVHESPLPPAQCADCHADETQVYQESIHGVSHSLGASGAANCADCHGAHDILSVKDHRSPVFKLNLPKTCANCHSNPGLTEEYRMRYP